MRKWIVTYVVLILAIPCLALAQGAGGSSGSLSGSAPGGAGLSNEGAPGVPSPMGPSNLPGQTFPRDPGAGTGLGTGNSDAGSEAGLGTEAPGRITTPGSTSETYRPGQGLPSGTGGPGPGAVPGSTDTGVYDSRTTLPSGISGPGSQVPGGEMPGTRMPGSEEGVAPGTSRYPEGSTGTTGQGLGTGTSR